MIRLTVIGEHTRAMVVTSAPYFRITGGAVWIGPDLHVPLVRYVAGCWEHGDVLWSGMCFEGKCRIVFGVPRDPAGVSDVIDALSIHGHILSGNGIPFAVYDYEREMWRGAEANHWWHAFRVESIGFRPATAPSQETSHTKPLHDPRDKLPDAQPPERPSEDGAASR